MRPAPSRVLPRETGPSAPSRRGVILVFFALFFLAFFGLFAVVVDLGIARTTQVQMQTSADVAALEGLAGRDALPVGTVSADTARRKTAASFAALVFDEDLDPATLPEQFLLGAGPVLSTGVGGIGQPAGGVLAADAPWVPALETNEAANLVHGDLVAGDYAALDPADPGRLDWHSEASDYGRFDFTPTANGGAFLARLRRTRPDRPLDRVEGVSSAGPTLPYLFGLGSGALSTPDPSVYDPRRDGITVRATAVADSRPVTMAGFARPGLTGLAPLGTSETGAIRWLSLDLEGWTSIPVATEVTLLVKPTGIVSGPVVGAAVVGQPRLGSVLVPGPTALPDAPPVELADLAYASVHQEIQPGVLQLRGFVGLTIEDVEVLPGPQLQLRVTKLGSTLAPRNASAQPTLASDPSIVPGLPSGGLQASVIAR